MDWIYGYNVKEKIRVFGQVEAQKTKTRQFAYLHGSDNRAISADEAKKENRLCTDTKKNQFKCNKSELAQWLFVKNVLIIHSEDDKMNAIWAESVENNRSER